MFIHNRMSYFGPRINFSYCKEAGLKRPYFRTNMQVKKNCLLTNFIFIHITVRINAPLISLDIVIFPYFSLEEGNCHLKPVFSLICLFEDFSTCFWITDDEYFEGVRRDVIHYSSVRSED